MSTKLALAEYRNLVYTLRPVKPLGACCGNVLLETVNVKPLENRSKAHKKKPVYFSVPSVKKCV